MKNQIKIGAVLNYISLFFNSIISFLFIPIILKYMGDNEYGLYTLVASVVAYFSVLDFGFGNAMIRYISRAKAIGSEKEEKNINSLFLILYSIIGIITLILGIILYFNMDKIYANTLTFEEISKVKIIAMISVVNIALSFPLSIFTSYATASEKFIVPKVTNIIRILLYPLIMFPLLIMGFKSITMIIVTSSLNILALLVNMYYCLKKLKMKLILNIKKVDFGIFKEISMYSFYIFLNLIVDNIFANTDQLILGIVSGTGAVLTYNFANQIKMVYEKMSTSINNVFLPKITKIISKGDEENEVSKIFIKISKVQTYVLLLILSGFIIFGNHFMNLWVGKEYSDSYIIVILLIGFSIIPLTQNIGITVLQAMNKHKFRSIVYIAIALLNIIITIPLAKLYDGIGAALGSVIAIILGQVIIMNIYYYKVAKLDIPLYWKNLIKITFPVLIVAYILHKAILNISMSWVKLILFGLIYSIIYIIYIYVIHLAKEEKDLIKNLLKKFIITKES